VLEYTEAECLCFESIQEERGYFRQGGRVRRVATLKTLPESRTRPFHAQSLQALGHPLTGRAFGYTLAVAIHIKPQARGKFFLKQRHKLVPGSKCVLRREEQSVARVLDFSHCQPVLASGLLHRGIRLQNARHERDASLRRPALQLLRNLACHAFPTSPRPTPPRLKGGFTSERSGIAPSTDRNTRCPNTLERPQSQNLGTKLFLHFPLTIEAHLPRQGKAFTGTASRNNGCSCYDDGDR
jgi:hypothetical protein